MAGYIAAVAGTAGVPLFIRTKGDLPQVRGGHFMHFTVTEFNITINLYDLS